MKKFFILALVLTLLLTACGSEPSSPPPLEHFIIDDFASQTSGAELTIIEAEPETEEGDAVVPLDEAVSVTFREGLPSGVEGYEDLPLVVTHANIKSAEVVIQNGEAAVSIVLDDYGAEKFAEATERLMGTGIPISIWIDDLCVSAPMVSSRITDGRIQISGGFSISEAEELVKLINNNIR
ncbi:MAG: hypothetical protein FWD48_05860 [Oscillospiraceae bacterium]|nr:hypothetical protein [Oscillospiraceae bacterium]